MRNGGRRPGISGLLSCMTFCLALGCKATSVSSPANRIQTTAEVAEAVTSALAEWLPDQLKTTEVGGAAAVVVGKDAIIWERVFGVTGAPGSPPVSPDTLFCIRSISKSITALAVLMAVQDGLVDLDTPIAEYLNDFTVHSRFDKHPENLITLRRMLSHWAGFTHDPPTGIDLTRPGYFERYIARISDTWLRFPVGYRHQYSNYGHDLASYVIQSRSGMSFAHYVRDKVLEPIGMTHSTFDLGIAERTENRALGHDEHGNVVPLLFPEIAAAGLHSSIRDMSRYAQFHLNGGTVNGHRLLREDLMKEYHSIQFPARGQRTGYCLGLVREVISNTFCLYHEGGGHGFGSHLLLYPEFGFGTVILTNREYHGLTGVQGRLIMNGPIINRYGPCPLPAVRTDAMRKLDTDDPRLKPILGRYGDSPGVVIGRENGVLGMRMSDGRFLPMAFYEDDGQLVGMYDATNEIRFLPPYAGRPSAMMTVSRILGNSNIHYRDFNDSPLDPPGPDRPEWQRHLGQYDVLWAGVPFSTAAVTTKNGYLYYRDGKCEEHEPGLFFLYNGETLDFRSTPPTFANLELRRKLP